MKFPCVELEVSYLSWFEKKLNHALKIDGDKLFKDLLTNKMFLGKFCLGILRSNFA